MGSAAFVFGLLLTTTPATAVADAPAETSAVWTFTRMMERVRQERIGEREARLRLDRANLGLEDARNTFYPALSVTGGVIAGTIEGQAPVDTYFGVRATPVLDGYEKFFAQQLARVEVEFGRLEEQEGRELLQSRIRQSYLSLLAMAKAQAYLEAAVADAERLVETASAESEPDFVALRRLEASAGLQRERMSLRALDDQRAEEELKLKTLLGLRPDEPFAVDTTIPPSDVLPSETPSPAAAPERSRAAIGLEAARERLRATRFESLPQPSLRVGLQHGTVDLRSGAYIQAGVEIPLFDWGQRKRDRARAALEVSAREDALKRAAIERQSDLARTELKRAALERRSQDLLESIDLADRRLKAQLALYQNGRLPAAELTRTQIEIARSRAEQAMNEGAIWTVLCQRDVLVRVGVVSAP